jgi:CRP-like cAMP-binding protein
MAPLSTTIVLKGCDNNSRFAVASFPLFSGIVKDDVEDICTLARIREFDRGEMLYLEGDSFHQVLMLISGVVKITQLGLSGTQVILRLGVHGDITDAGRVFTADKHCTTAHAFRPCRVLAWDADNFKALVKRYPVLYQNMCQVNCERLKELEERFREVATERVGTRVARQMVRLLDQIGRHSNGVIEIGLSREELAQMTGTTLFTVSRLLSAWEARGLVRPRREAVAVYDVPSLRAVSE